MQVEAGDSGQYRCRVDYEVSPTRNTRIKLKLVGEQLLVVVEVDSAIQAWSFRLQNVAC